MTFNLLSKNIQKKIWDMKWDRFTPIQDSTIPVIINSSRDVIVSSGTASGKTEAAFLPILSLVEKAAASELKVLYISPLKALINNQFERIEKLCEHTHIPIHKWHGDVSQSVKKKFLKEPAGILQITPESIESLFINRTEQIRVLFKGLDFVVIDEIHSFLNNDRGVHLRSLLSRIETIAQNRPRIIGLSATIDNFEFVKNWVNYTSPEEVEIVDEKVSEKQLLYYLMHFPEKEDGEAGNKLEVSLFEDIRELTRNQKAIIFCNDRGSVEEVTVFLNRLAAREKVGETYYAHHSSIDKKEREYVEKTMMESKMPKTVVATSTLELGLDIGDVDIVIQLNSTFTVSSLKQRLGRSGRKRDARQMLQMYTTKRDSLFQSLAVMELALDKWIEPATGYAQPYDILFHQIISICTETNGITMSQLLERLERNHIFYQLNTTDVQLLINHMLEQDYLEMVKGPNELIVGLAGERILRSRDFYAVFITPEEYTVLEGVRKIGTLDKSTFLGSEGDNIILAGKLWTIKQIDTEKNKIYVLKAVNGKPPRYSSSGLKLHKKIGEKIMEILCDDHQFHYINQEAFDSLNDERKFYHDNQIKPGDRVIREEDGSFLLESFTGTVIAQTLGWLLRAIGFGAKIEDGLNRMRIEGPLSTDVLNFIKKEEWEEARLFPLITESELYNSKFSPYLPDELFWRIHAAHEIDIEGTIKYLNEFEFKFIDCKARK
ncbi:DEAD/DEAH box helicase [Anaerobacillus isosaccharinicus]|uniref:DEAD/DEAH box helicase n=1 Tax=Anaerobacillus isosaccharinicus TaxID=1532552 RepID=A0A1S2M697_9BACI|nr:DEAD/DEAH box helicase [Anaerobacillus isosaccharinicus]MBA5586451.1 DEAD/DEAH box helicase [Anaerobacillus isosaccharinicus]QOY35306.1 DEAD/DEAH box helicase [Anaerobacillus isosaccharinicus]